jgi:hypothetical protein
MSDLNFFLFCRFCVVIQRDSQPAPLTLAAIRPRTGSKFKPHMLLPSALQALLLLKCCVAAQ